MDESSLPTVADNLVDLLLIMRRRDLPIDLRLIIRSSNFSLIRKRHGFTMDQNDLLSEWGPIDFLNGCRRRINHLISTLQELSRFFKKHYGNKTLAADAATVTSAALDAQVIISDLLHDYIRQEQKGFFNRAIFFLIDLEARRKNARVKLDSIEWMLNYVIHGVIDLVIGSTFNSITSTEGGEYHDVDLLNIMGREKDIQVIQDKLISAETDIFRLISVVGMAGIGKTCLARKIYNSHQVRTHFDCLAWICARRQSGSTRELLKAIAQQVMGCGRQQRLLHLQEDQQGSSLSEEAEIFTITNTIFDFLAEKRYLIVIDGILSNGTWSDLGGAFPRGSTNGSRILLTACNTTIVLAAQYDNFFRHPTEDFLNPYQLGPLNDAESWELFSNKVSLPLDLLSSYKKEIVKKCDGLPLAILHLANLLSKENKNRTDHGDHEGSQLVLDSVDTDDCLGRPWTSHIVDTIVSDLPHHLKRCLFYFRYFPKYSKIPSRRLIALWVAEELVEMKLFEEPKQPEVVGEGYLEQLIQWNMIEVVKYSSNQTPKKCCLAYFLREHLLFTSTLSVKQHNQGSSSGSSSSSRGTKGGVLRLADHAHNGEVMASPEQNRSLLSFLSFDYREGLAPSERLRNFLYGRAINKGCFRLLRVLDLERVYKPVLPKEIGRLTQLRYLGLRWTYVDTLPSSILNLKKLQTLDLKHTYIESLPEPLADIYHLQHLYLNETQLTQSQCMPRDLQTLWGIFLGEGQILNTLWWQSELTQLRLVCHLPSDPDQEEMANCILRLNRLQKLRLTSKDQLGKTFSLTLKHFTNHKDLSDLNLFGRLEKLLMVHEFPPNLTELTLSASNLKLDPMPTLGMLPKLTILRLYADTYIGKCMVCSSSSGFFKLQVLKIWKLKQLEEWDVEEGSMPALRRLEIRACNSLSKLPDRLQEITTLKELKISDMPIEFTAMVKRNKDKEWYKKANVCFDDWETRNSSTEATSSSTSSSSSFGRILLLFLLLFLLLSRVNASPTKHSTRVQGLPALGRVRC